ncbi:MAG: hypothetical protein M3384_03340 [Acidobacteriota bacterium]|nr:hypothetical protein [Acidobacteriota bacterium]
MVFVCAILLSAASFALSKNSEKVFNFFESNAGAETLNQKSLETANKTTQGSLPNNPASDYVLFEMLFNSVKAHELSAAKLESEGKSGRIWREYFQNRAGLTTEQLNILRQTANEFMQAVEPTHRAAKEIINQRRAERANGQAPTPAPPQLVALQHQRQAIALTHRNRLQGMLGNEAFEQLRQFLRRNTSSGNGMQTSNFAEYQSLLQVGQKEELFR